MKLDIEEISCIRSFVFLWCGSGEGLDLGRMVQISQSHTEWHISVCCTLSPALIMIFSLTQNVIYLQSQEKF